MSIKIYSSGSEVSQNQTQTNPIIFKVDSAGGTVQKQLYLRHNYLSGPDAEGSYGITVDPIDFLGTDESTWFYLAPDSSGIPGTYGSAGASMSFGDVLIGQQKPFWLKMIAPSTTNYGIKTDVQLKLTANQTHTEFKVNLAGGTHTNTVYANNKIRLVAGQNSGYWVSDWIDMGTSRGLVYDAKKTSTGSVSFQYRTSSNATNATATAWVDISSDLNSTDRYLQIKVILSGISYSNMILADSPVGYWRLNETSGTAVDIVNGNNLSESGGSIPSTTGLLSGSSDTARLLSSGKFFTGAATNINPTSSGLMSIECWVKPTAINSYMSLPSKWNGSLSSWLFRVDSGMLRFFTHLSGTTNIINSSATITANNTYHLVATYDGTTGRIYINGSLVANGTMVRPQVSTTQSFNISLQTDSPSDTWFPGTQDEVAFYQYALTSAQILAHYNKGLNNSSDSDISELYAVYDGAQTQYFDIRIYYGPETLELLNPPNGSTTSLFAPDLSVEAHNCDHIEWQMDTVSTFDSSNLSSWTTLTIEDQINTSHSPTTNRPSGLWYWRARCILNGVAGAWSEIWSFTITAIPNNALGIYLNINNGINAISTNLADSYYINVNNGIELIDTSIMPWSLYLNVNNTIGTGSVIYPIEDDTVTRKTTFGAPEDTLI